MKIALNLFKRNNNYKPVFKQQRLKDEPKPTFKDVLKEIIHPTPTIF